MIYDYDTNWSDNSCNSYEDTSFPSYQSVGMTYVPMQKWSRPMPLKEGFYKGTIFEDLDKPFLGRCM